jgi:P27 family predicted phage terminase small subunit
MKKINEIDLCGPLKRNPKHLKGLARQKWNELLDVLPPEVTTARQADSLTQYAEAWALYRQVVEQMKDAPLVVESKTGALSQHPLSKQRVELHKILFSLGSRIGVVPEAKYLPKGKGAASVGKFAGLVG